MAELAGHIAAAPSGHWRPYAAVGLSVVLPGSGHLLLGRWRRAIPFLTLSAAATVAAYAFWARGTFGMLELLVQPQFVRSVMAINVGVMILQIAAAADTLWVGQPQGPGAVKAALGALLSFLLVMPHIAVADRADALLGLLDDKFVAEEDVGAAMIRHRRETAANRAASTAAPVTTTASPPTTAAWIFEEPDGVVVPLYGSAPPPQTEDVVLDRITVLLAGGDAGPGRDGERTDVMIVATLDREAGRASLITVSRELVEVPLPVWLRKSAEDWQESWWDRAVRAEEEEYSVATDPEPEERDPELWLDRLNAVYPLMRGLTTLYPGSPDPGMEAIADTISYALGVPIDYYVLVDMAGFVDMIDAIGGVTVTSNVSMHVKFSPAKEGDEEIVIEIEPGRHHLDGRLALAYVRNRTGSSDIVRTRRQRCMLTGFATQADLGRVVRNFERIARAFDRHTTTNVPVRLLPHIVSQLAGLDRGDISSMAIQAGPLARDKNYRNLPVFDAERTRRAVARFLDGAETGYSSIDSGECG